MCGRPSIPDRVDRLAIDDDDAGLDHTIELVVPVDLSQDRFGVGAGVCRSRARNDRRPGQPWTGSGGAQQAETIVLSDHAEPSTNDDGIHHRFVEPREFVRPHPVLDEMLDRIGCRALFTPFDELALDIVPDVSEHRLQLRRVGRAEVDPPVLAFVEALVAAESEGQRAGRF